MAPQLGKAPDSVGFQFIDMALIIALVEVILAFSATLLLAVYYFRNKRDPRYPPGPRALPVIGNLLQLVGNPQQTLMRWAEKYGPVFSMKMGSDDAIILSDHKIIKEVFQDSAANGRATHPIFLALGNGNYGIIMAEGAHWEQQRRFTLRKLRDFGFAKTAMEGLILEEVNGMIRWFETRLGEPITGNKIFNGAVVNSLWSIMSGERQEWDGPEPPKMLKYSQDMVDSFNQMNACGLTFAPFLRHVAPNWSGWTGWLKGIEGLNNTANESVKRHLKVLDEDDPRDFIDHYLIEKENEKDPTSSFYKEAGVNNLRVVVPDLFLAGSETTSHTLSFAMLLLAHNQSVQKKLHEELDKVLGQSRQPSITDKPSLPYAEATMMEVLRRTSLSVNGVPHRMTRDAVFQGYFFPKDTTVISNLFLVNNDPKVWGDPEIFRPERFLSKDGTKVVKHEALIPFSVGKRQRLGESLAKDSLFLFLTGIFQRFHLRPDPKDNGNAINMIEPSTKILNEPEPFKIIVSLRN